ncbi:galactosylgalactosylxylosylprotein 3-beta-glucuronosyltransferase P isoform X2 [Nilaparvata lugens]|uniref:galactosylgalactosylxylosylprotein 3-beta-glucuronosyltransferase P isoform X2 n=1 Tax=Nilaparvata lugens TaxID=108931 RepID=UPI000B9859D1|nr:galactosylgalactosylxylosylprotein 3-beta-glucuronosyltransferase P isoform X2 [Nilaparvata lugens]XP_039298378.1 galactosylgalactosylxylosylprotein 3-beta-glucuronosyltransferase P isoform X2 [Nilaparvata lugens]
MCTSRHLESSPAMGKTIVQMSRKLWLLMIIGACLIVAQYQLASVWLVTAPSTISYEHQSAPVTSASVQAIVNKLQLDTSIVNTVGEKVLREIALQMGQQMLEVCEVPPLSHRHSSKPSVQSNAFQFLPPLYIITPTYRRPEQVPELTRLAQTLMHVPNLHWLVIEDAHNQTTQVTELLQRTGIRFEHLVAPMPESYKKKKGSKPRGVSNRNKGLQWLRANATDGVFYFADDDNTYDIALFSEMRFTRKVSMWPVGLCTKFGISTPVIHNGTFFGFYDGWMAGRKFPVDMASFAVSVQFLHERPDAIMPFKPGFEEDGFLRSLSPFDPKDIEFKAENCTKILVWHTQTKKNEPAAKLDIAKYNNTNLVKLRSLIV